MEKTYRKPLRTTACSKGVNLGLIACSKGVKMIISCPPCNAASEPKFLGLMQH